MLVLAVCALDRASAQVRFPERPPERVFVVDEANLINDADEAAIVQLCDKLLTNKKIPILVVTVTSMGHYGSSGPIERYASQLFDDWGIGFPDYNYGILLLVANGDRKARIELGADWGREHDSACQRIMDEIVIPKFKAGQFSTGIHSGTEALDKLARGEAIPYPGFPVRATRATKGFLHDARSELNDAIDYLGNLFLAMIALPILLVVRYFFPDFFDSDSGGGSGGFGFGGGGSWGGGSFGGGSSGGGGATGSW